MQIFDGLFLGDLEKSLGMSGDGRNILFPAGFKLLDEGANILLVLTLEVVRIGGGDKRRDRPFRAPAEVFRRALEVFGRGLVPAHEGRAFGRTSERIERDVRGFARTSKCAIAGDEERIGVHFEHFGLMRRGAADAEAVRMRPLGILFLDVVFVRAQQVLHVVNRPLLRGDGGVRELFRIRDVLADDLVPGEVVAAGVVVGGAAFGRSDGNAVVEVAVDAFLGGLVATVLDGALDHARSNDDVLGVSCVNLVHHEVVRNVDNFIVLHAPCDPRIALMNGQLPGFVRVSDRISAAFREVAVLAEKLDGDVDGVTGARGALGHQAADAVADAAILGRHDVVLVNARAGIRDDRDAVFIDEAVGEGGAGRIEGLRPEEAEGLFNLRNGGGSLFELDHFAGLVSGSRDPVLSSQNAAAVVLIVAYENVARGAGVLADDDRRAGGGVEGHGAHGGTDRENGKLGLEVHLFLLKRFNCCDKLVLCR